MSNTVLYTVWKNTVKRDHDFYSKINIFSVKSIFSESLECVVPCLRFSNFHTVRSSLFLRKNQHFFRQIDVFTKEVKKLISRKFLSVIAFYNYFSTLCDFFCENIAFTKFLSKTCSFQCGNYGNTVWKNDKFTATQIFFRQIISV